MANIVEFNYGNCQYKVEDGRGIYYRSPFTDKLLFAGTLAFYQSRASNGEHDFIQWNDAYLKASNRHAVDVF